VGRRRRRRLSGNGFIILGEIWGILQDAAFRLALYLV
jgi:hypothetical protein